MAHVRTISPATLAFGVALLAGACDGGDEDAAGGESGSDTAALTSTSTTSVTTTAATTGTTATSVSTTAGSASDGGTGSLSTAGSGGDDGTSGGGDTGSAAATCSEYCAVVTLACVGPHEQYTDATQCEDYCGAWAGLPEGTFGELSGNSIACRLAHAELALTDPTTQCPAAGRSGAGVCGTWCENYCFLADRNCTGAEALYASAGECMTACAQFPSDGQPDDMEGDSVQCRLFHLGLAGMDPQAPALACPRGSQGGAGVCVGPL